ncbi:MAG TPA: hypothetical protein DGT21_00370, partial [Armatimonadetes bacterium]|nr:hypothetical protein [Armatimonadota bacterium]
TERGHIANLEFPASQSAPYHANAELKIRDVTPVASEAAVTLLTRLNRAIESDPARAATYTDRFRELADALKPLAAQTDTPGAAAAALWMLSECHRAQGQFRAADAAFDAYLAALRNVYNHSELPDAYAAVARSLIGPTPNGSPTVTELIRSHTFADGTHPADRAWQACLAALADLHAAAPQEYEAALCATVKDSGIRCTPCAKRLAYATLEQQFPAAASRPDVASAAAKAFARSDTEKATALLTGALAASPSDAEKPSILFNLLMEQSKSVDTLEQAQATYDQLAPFGSDRKYASLTKTGLWHLADLYHRAGKPETALALVQQYVSTYGSDDFIDRLSARVRAEKP